MTARTLHFRIIIFKSMIRVTICLKLQNPRPLMRLQPWLHFIRLGDIRIKYMQWRMYLWNSTSFTIIHFVKKNRSVPHLIRSSTKIKYGKPSCLFHFDRCRSYVRTTLLLLMMMVHSHLFLLFMVSRPVSPLGSHGCPVRSSCNMYEKIPVYVAFSSGARIERQSESCNWCWRGRVWRFIFSEVHRL